MTVQEFSHEFDVLYNNITNGVAPGVNEYEKSVFLTRSLNQFIHDILIGNTTTGDNVDSTTKTKLQLKPLYKKESIQFNSNGSNTYPADILYILNTNLVIDNNKIPVVPVSYDDLNSILNNPFYSSKRRAYIVQTEDGTKNIYYQGQLLELNYELVIDYIRYPKPIILEDLEEGFTIDSNIDGFYNGNGYKAQTSELPEFTHFEILKRAIQMALVANGVADS